jgi:hypothetical protein
MSTIKRNDLHASGTAANEGWLGGAAANRGLPLEQRTLRCITESSVERDRTVIPFM